ncbi:MAG: YgaP family membrane protein [Cognatishimia sp.]|uniref:YgaP family membrane protein n=1 Tax=Cognatishimia sp. 1_MG-2023 TaxID=3062642 RepID=UPI0026E11699|nr:DUF2892 domain-containing protein [Cognatishimia sp. 1_MG-2023]MDO6727273.1 DUF2892 domain-containing protein [Cognatishimia sp. 1_MG-2023]
MFTKNLGTFDRAARLIIGVLLIIGALMGYGAWMWIGVIPLFTGLINNCPLYSILGISTCKRSG